MLNCWPRGFRRSWLHCVALGLSRWILNPPLQPNCGVWRGQQGWTLHLAGWQEAGAAPASSDTNRVKSVRSTKKSWASPQNPIHKSLLSDFPSPPSSRVCIFKPCFRSWNDQKFPLAGSQEASSAQDSTWCCCCCFPRGPKHRLPHSTSISVSSGIECKCIQGGPSEISPVKCSSSLETPDIVLDVANSTESNGQATSPLPTCLWRENKKNPP